MVNYGHLINFVFTNISGGTVYVDESSAACKASPADETSTMDQLQISAANFGDHINLTPEITK